MAAQRGAVNLEGRAQNTQLRLGVLAVALGLAGAVAMKSLGAGTRVHALLVPLLFVGVYGLCAGLSRTCGVTAMAGRRITCSGSERIADRAELAKVRRRGMMVIAMSLFVSLCATAVLSFLSR